MIEIFYTKPQSKNRNTIYFDLYSTVINNRDGKEEEVVNEYDNIFNYLYDNIVMLNYDIIVNDTILR